MNNEEKDIEKANIPTTPPTVDEQKQVDAINELEEDIIRNDTIPETKDQPGSNGAYPVGAFDTSKD